MRIYKMTATFGKLEHAQLELKPGLNVIEAPNEWGKSTWCAFLLAMLYGLDTRAKTTKTALADKERFAPWSRSPMSGRIDLHWNGRDITIERSTKGRVPMGVFRAYETASGVELPELTAANCGSVLLGVEQSVFRRSGFIRQADMPVTQDEALRRRLNDLVTTGDETGDGDRLEKELKDLKNRCRYNRSGLLPQAEAEEKGLEEKIAEWYSLESHSGQLKQRLAEEKQFLRQLENHKAALAYAAAEADAARVAEARDHRDRAEHNLAEAESACAKLPPAEEARQKIQDILLFQSQWNDLQEQLRQLPEVVAMPAPPVPCKEGELETDIRRYEGLGNKLPWLGLILAAAVVLLSAIAFGVSGRLAAMGAGLAVGILLLFLGLRTRKNRRAEMAALEEKYGSSEPDAWRKLLADYRESLSRQRQQQQSRQELENVLNARWEALEAQRQTLCGSRTLQQALELWQQVLQQRERQERLRREFQQAEKYLAALQAMVKPAEKPSMEDALAYNLEDTLHLMADTRAQQQRLVSRLGQYQGRMEALGDRETLCAQLQQVQQRIEKLERIYRAASLGLETLMQARQELQRRFAPRIAKRAQELLGRMTAGRYDRLSLNADLSLLAGAEQEEVLHEALWRSDGTVDQLYFALRLAVAEELTPHAPLILDDAFVRFDDTRLRAAIDILKREAEEKQVILFTCQHREKVLVQ